MQERAFSRVLWTGWILSGALCQPLPAQDHAGQYSQTDIERGLRLYGPNCAPCHGANGDLVARVDLRTGKFRNATSDEDLGRVIAAGIPGTAMPAHKFDRSELAGIVAYIRSMRDFHAKGPEGDADRGKLLFEGKGGCLSCHRVMGQGSRLAPDLSEIGAVRFSESLQGSLLEPTAFMIPINRPVRAVTRDGKVINGRRLNEDTYSVQLVDSEERLLSLIKAELREYTVLKVSPMPSYREKLNSQELADVVAYLLTLRGVN
jgi:putative heme-binding domain-containing protein